MYRIQKYRINKRDESENEPVGRPFGEFESIQACMDWANILEPAIQFTYEIISAESGRLMSRRAFDWE